MAKTLAERELYTRAMAKQMTTATVHDVGDATVAIVIKSTDRYEALGEAHRVARKLNQARQEAEVMSYDEKSGSVAVFIRFVRTSDKHKYIDWMMVLAAEVA